MAKSKRRNIQKDVSAKARGKSGKVSGKREKRFAPLEKLLIFLFSVFMAALPISYFMNKDIMTYVSMAIYFILGLAILVKPDLVLEIMRKKNKRFEQIYGSKIKNLAMAIRIFGILFIGGGAYLLYSFV